MSLAPNKRLRIAIITRNFATHGGGAERYAVAIAEQLAARHELHVFAQAIEHDDPRMSYHRLPSMRKPRWLNQWLFARKVARLVQHGFDIVHSHENGWAGNVQTVHVRPMRHNLLPPGSGLAQRVAQGLKIISSLRLMTYLRLEAARFAPCPGRTSSKRIIGVVSATLRDEMAASYPASAACLYLIPPGVVVPEVMLEKSAARQVLGVPLEGVLLLFVANDYRRKGLDTLLAALATQVDVHLLIVGNPDQAAEYQARAQSLGLAGRGHFLGRQADMPPVYAAADVLVHPTLEDSFGMVVLEAMAQGVPVVVSRAPYCGLSAELAEDEAVLLHDPRSKDELAAALQSLLHDAPRRAALAEAGRKVAARYDWATQAQRYEQLYFALLGEAA